MDTRLLYIGLITSLIFIIPFIGIIIYKQLKKYNIQKNDVLMGIDISKVLINLTENLLLEYGFYDNRDKSKVKLISGMIVKTVAYVTNIKSDSSIDYKVREGMNIIKDILWEHEVILSSEEESMISNIIRVGIGAVGNCK